MRRYQYRLNDQNVAVSPWARLQPLKYIETVPGETYGGTITVKATGGLVDQIVHSRAYYDLYAFYCPIRLLWDGFPKFLASSEGDVQPPQIETLFPENFESSFVGDQSGSSKNSAFLRRMYYAVHGVFFHKSHGKGKKDASTRLEQVRDGYWDSFKELMAVEARPSTLDNSWLNEDEVDKQYIISTASGQEPARFMQTDLDDIRRAYALDRWEKIRDYYGGHYTDLLKGYGVKADWGILQEPECIGVSNNDFKFVQRNSTGDTKFGERNGYFEGEYKLKIRKTFTPEHGIIGFFAAPRADVFNETQGAHILCTRDDKSPSNWWDPISSRAYSDQTMPANIVDTGFTGRLKTPLYEHLRKGRNEVAVPAGIDWDTLPVAHRKMTEYKESEFFVQRSCEPQFKAPSDGTKVNVGPTNICHYAETRLAKRSPVQPGGITSAR